MAVSPVVAGRLGSTSIRGVFIVDAATMAIVAPADSQEND
jgi:hypothetical protein